jgi:cation transport regulator ChaC
MGDGWVWRFGYGSNLSLANLVEKKNLRPVDFVTGRIRGWRLSFDLAAIPHVEPAFATVRPAQGEEVHGVAFRISAAEAAGLDRQEGGYTVEPVGVETYEGRVIGDVGLYVPRRAGTPGLLPSLRYLRLLRRGARDAGLQA